VLYTRRLDFRRFVWLEQSTNIILTGTALLVAVWTRNVWALVASQLASVVAVVALSYALDSYRPRLAFDTNAFRQAFAYSRHLFLIGVTAYITTTADNVVVGRVLGAAALGSYLIAYNLASTPVAIIARIFGGVLFPAYYEASDRGRGNSPQATRLFEKAFAVSAALLATISVMLVLLSAEIVQLLFGPKWSEAAPILRILALICFARGLLQIAGTFILTIRRPWVEARAKLFESAIFLAALYPLTLRYGLVGAAWSGAIVYVVALCVRLKIIGSFAPEAQRTALGVLLRVISSGLAGLLAGVVTLKALTEFIGIQNAAARLVVGALACMIVMLPLSLALLPAFRKELFGFVARVALTSEAET
jgi:O-antigen/teichoic acid export membrane protein